MSYREQLPQLDADVFLADGGIETTLIFDDGFELPDFAAFDLLGDSKGRRALDAYFDVHASIAARDGVGIVLDTPTWRASPDWVSSHGADLDQVNRDAVALVEGARAKHESANTPVVISGCIGPRGDGYQPGELMTAEESRDYHAAQARAFADSAADIITVLTMNYAAEAIGVALAARDAAMPVAIAFTVETDGTLPTGQSLGEAIETVDGATDASPAYFMINCAHPTHFAHVLDPAEAWTKRVRGIRANASRMSHAELDEAEELDPGDPEELAELYRDLRDTHPQLTVLGGCCGTNHRHIDAISAACIRG